MRPLKIFSLLISIGQFLLILKLIEMVRGSPTSSKVDVMSNSAEGRSFYLSPAKAKGEKKYRLWGTTTTEETPTTDISRLLGLDADEENLFDDHPNNRSNHTTDNSTPFKTNNVKNKDSPVKDKDPDSMEGRLCPGCEGGQCGGSLTKYGFPVIPVVIAIIVGIVWFFIFLFLWYFAIKPPKEASGYPESMAGYGYGSGGEASNSGWGSSEGTSGGFGSILNFFSGIGHKRSSPGLDQLTSLVTDSLYNLAKLYN